MILKDKNVVITGAGRRIYSINGKPFICFPQ